MEEKGKARSAVAGAVSVLLAIGVSEFVAGLGAGGPSVLSAVGEVVIRRAPLPVEEFVISTFGLYDKLFLVVLMTTICAGIGALLGVAARRRPAVAVIGFALFAVAGGLAARVHPQARVVGFALPPAAGAVFGLGALWLMLRTSSHATGRRAFLRTTAAFAALAAASASGGRWLLTRASGAVGVILPRPARPARAVSTGAQAAGAAPVVTSNAAFYRVDILLDPLKVPLEAWRLEIGGLVEHPFALTWPELLEMPMVEDYVTLTCVSNEVGGDLVGNARWQGVPLELLLARAGVRREADFLVSRSVDGFTVGCELAAARDGRPAMIAVGMNGEALPVEHGFPARLVVSGLYGYVSSTKWLRSIELTTHAAYAASDGARGLATQSPIKTGSRIDAPKARTTLSAGPQIVAGVAWAQHRGIRKVEVQVDDDPWREALLADAISDDAWRGWTYSWDAPAGSHTLRVRATDGQGRVQTAERQRPSQGGATGHHVIHVTVASH